MKKYGYSNFRIPPIGQAPIVDGIYPAALPPLQSIGDVPAYAQVAYSNLVKNLDQNGYWIDVDFIYPILPTKTKFGYYREGKSNTELATQVKDSSNNGIDPTSLGIYNYPRAYGSLHGFNAWEAGAILLGINSNSIAANDRTTILLLQDSDTQNVGYNFGAFGGAEVADVFQKNATAADIVSVMGYDNSPKIGYSASGADLKGSYGIVVDATTTRLYINGTQKDTIATNGVPPALELLWNGYKTATSNGGGAHQTTGLIIRFKKAFDATAMAEIQTFISQYQTDIKRTGTYDFHVFTNGDSHSVYHNKTLGQHIEYGLAGLSTNDIGVEHFGISGTSATSLITNQATHVFPRIKSGMSPLYYILMIGTNDISSGDTPAALAAKIETICGNIKTECTSKSVTCKIGVVPLLNRGYPGEDAKKLAQSDYNVLLRNGTSVPSADKVFDLPAYLEDKRSNYGSDAAFFNAITTWTGQPPYIPGDTTHLDFLDTGYPVIATEAVNWIKTDRGIS